MSRGMRGLAACAMLLAAVCVAPATTAAGSADAGVHAKAGAKANAPARNDAALWAALRKGGHIILIRHAATEPGMGDPPGYTIEDCKTQRNLSVQGREDAKRLGEMLKRNNVPVGEVKSSLWCRCLDTAMLAFGRVDAWSALNNFFDAPHLEGAATEAVRARFAMLKPAGPNVVMVTHGVNIAALSGLSPGTAEMIILKPNGTKTPPVVGRLYAK